MAQHSLQNYRPGGSPHHPMLKSDLTESSDISHSVRAIANTIDSAIPIYDHH